MAFNPLSHELKTILRAIRFQNLSVAAQNVGISQSQLSRIVKKLEGELGFELLDRKIKRKAFWTPAAVRLADALDKGQRLFLNQLREVSASHQLTEVHLGTLEGLATHAIRLAHGLLKLSEIQLVSVDVLDIAELDDMLLKGFFDGIFSIRTPGRRKFQLQLTLGHQAFEKFAGDIAVQSHFEFAQVPARKKKRALPHKTFLSNSLMVRRRWLEELGGFGQIPGPVHTSRRERRTSEMEVLFLGNDTLSPYWENVSQILQVK